MSPTHRAIDLDPGSCKAWSSLGLIQVEQRRYKDAADSFARSLALAPLADYVLGDLMHSRMHVCDWAGFDESLARMKEQVGEGRKVVNPFSVLALTADLAILRKAAEVFALHQRSEAFRLGPVSKRARHDRIRIGYYSALRVTITACSSITVSLPSKVMSARQHCASFSKVSSVLASARP